MSVKIRLKRAGSKKRPFYRVVVTDSRNARDSRSIEDIGYYNPLEDPVVVNVDREKVAYWTGQGAQPSETVRTLLRRENTVHQSRRASAVFTPAVVEAPKPKKTEKKAKAAKADKAPEAATAVVEVPLPEAAPAEAAAEAPVADAAPEAAEAAAEAPAPEAAEPKPDASDA